MIWSALILGVMGSIHCMVMCGPIAWTINHHRQQGGLDKIFYNLGRMISYTALGAMAGTFGMGIQWASGQQFLSVASGIILLLGLALSWNNSRKNVPMLNRLMVKFKISMGQILGSSSRNMLWFGIYNGLLPCGLTYVALAGALAGGTVFKGMAYMAIFGLGTSPMMWAVFSGAGWIQSRGVFAKPVITTFTWVLALVLILRGLDLGVPYLSPHLSDKEGTSVTICN